MMHMNSTHVILQRAFYRHSMQYKKTFHAVYILLSYSITFDFPLAKIAYNLLALV